MQVLRSCNYHSPEKTGFELSKNETLDRLFPKGINIGLKFSVGNYEYEVKDIIIYKFYINNLNRSQFTLDDKHSKLGTHIWILCKTEDPRITISRYDEESLKQDLGVS